MYQHNQRKELIVTTTENIPGHQYEIIGEIFGVTTQSKNAISNFSAGIKKYFWW